MPEGPFDIILSRYAVAKLNELLKNDRETYMKITFPLNVLVILFSRIFPFKRSTSCHVLGVEIVTTKVCLYLQSPQLSTVLVDMVQRLRPGGFLVIGAKEPCQLAQCFPILTPAGVSTNLQICTLYMGVSKNRGIPK